MSAAARRDLVIVGAGFAGMYMLHRARGLGLDARLFEAASGVGGTWYWNRYPGARCDVESMEYSYQFDEALQQEWKWSERYAAQPEILRYANHVADRFGLWPDMQFNTRIVSAFFDEKKNLWIVKDDKNETIATRFLVMATGCLSQPNKPAFEGLASFGGEIYITGQWPHHAVDFAGKRVAVVGTGSSAVQSIPIIAAQAKELTVFQRTAAYSVPAENGPLDPEYEARVKADYRGYRERSRRMPNALGFNFTRSERSVFEAAPQEREREFESRWRRGGFAFLAAYPDLMLDPKANTIPAEFVRAKIRATVKDPETARLLSPHQTIGCKRLCVDSGYYATFNRPNVRLVDVNTAPIERLTPRGLRAGGRDYEFDCIIFATGFDAMTGALLAMDLRGRGGLTLREKWREGPRAYLGLAMAGFPNLFIVTGPGSPSVLTNMMVSIEQHVEWIADCIAHLRSRQQASIEARGEAEEGWLVHVAEVAGRTVYPHCGSWYVGANVAGKPRAFMPLIGFPPYVEKCREEAARGYASFAIRP